ncbi:MAG: pilus assembly FimT family protein [Candidatus Altimarinota bacterium]
MENLLKKISWKKSSAQAAVQKGFTLIELLMAITIFMIFLVVATNSYLSIVRAQKVANETRIMYSDLRNFVDLVNNEMRSGKIDYFCYERADSQVVELDEILGEAARCDDVSLTVGAGDNLRIISKDDLNSIIIKFAAGEESVEGDVTSGRVLMKRFSRNVEGLWSVVPGYEDWQEVAFANLNVEQLRFEIKPLKDPAEILMGGNLSNQFQPGVSLVIKVKSTNPSVQFDLDFQTFISSRSFN